MVFVEKVLNLFFYAALSIFIIGIIFLNISSMVQIGYLLLKISIVEFMILSIVFYTLKKKKKNK
jgi:hypothetical protein